MEILGSIEEQTHLRFSSRQFSALAASSFSSCLFVRACVWEWFWFWLLNNHYDLIGYVRRQCFLIYYYCYYTYSCMLNRSKREIYEWVVSNSHLNPADYNCMLSSLTCPGAIKPESDYNAVYILWLTVGYNLMIQSSFYAALSRLFVSTKVIHIHQWDAKVRIFFVSIERSDCA